MSGPWPRRPCPSSGDMCGSRASTAPNPRGSEGSAAISSNDPTATWRARSAREDSLPPDESCVCGMSNPIPLRLRPSTKAIRTTASSGRAMVRAITFDAFGTLIDTGRDVLIRIARSVCDDQRPSLDAEALLATWDRHFFAAETAPFLTLAEITEDSLGKTFREYGIEAIPAPYVDRLVDLWRQAKAYAEVPRILDALDGVPRAVVSNADHEFLLDILERNGLRFDAVVTSESAQTYKPRPRIFEAALESLRVRPSDVIHVGDSLVADVEGASRLGMRTVWVNRAALRRGPADPTPDAEARDLNELPAIVERLSRDR